MSKIKEALKHSKINDTIYTPEVAVRPLIEFLDKDLVVWECTGRDSKITKVLRDNGFVVIETTIPELDFLKDEPDFEFDMIITNSPYSLKDKFIERCYEYGKPFALLLPITGLEGIKRGEMFNKHGIQVLVFNRRINFTEGGACWFNTSWFCWKILDRDLKFIDVEV